MSLRSVEPRGLTQRGAAVYLGVSVAWFRDHVHVEPVPVGLPRDGVKPVLRYLRDDLDRWVERCRAAVETERRAG